MIYAAEQQKGYNMTLMKLIAVTLFTGLAAQVAFADSSTTGGTHDDHVSTIGDVRLLHGWTRATRDDTALVFVEIENAGQVPVTLTGGSASFAETDSLVGFANVDGEPTYQNLAALPIAPGTEMVLSPQGVALQLAGLSDDLIEGESFEMTLSFAEAEVVLTVEVEAADALQHSHAGHAH